MPKPGVISGIMSFGGSEDSNIIENYFPTKGSLRMAQLSEITPRLEFPVLVAEMMQAQFKSKLLRRALDTLYVLQVGADRKGRDEYAEVAAAIRRGAGIGEDDE